jgi:hypothetical protein
VVTAAGVLLLKVCCCGSGGGAAAGGSVVAALLYDQMFLKSTQALLDELAQCNFASDTAVAKAG